MENKKTTELLDLLWTKESKEEFDDEFDEIKNTLLSREPFYTSAHDVNGTLLSESLDETDTILKQLKRHKHDPKSDDVMIRI